MGRYRGHVTLNLVQVESKRVRAKIPGASVGRRSKAWARAFKFKTDEAELLKVVFRGKPRLIRVVFSERDAKKDFYLKLILNSLYPQNSVRPVAVVRINGAGKWGVVMDTVKSLSKNYLKFQESFYSGPLGSSERMAATRSVWGVKHAGFVQAFGIPLRDKIYSDTGITIDSAKVNIGEKQGVPIFFEVWGITPYKFKAFLETVADEKKRRALAKIFSKYQQI
jgi:hypothetical protein